MPAVRKPTSVLEASGAFDANPKRRRANEPDTGRGIGPAPETLSENVRVVWDEIVGNCAAGVFQSSDRTMMEMLARLIAEFRENPGAFGGRKYQTLLALLARCGMTPSDRSRVFVPAAPDDGKAKSGLASFR